MKLHKAFGLLIIFLLINMSSAAGNQPSKKQPKPPCRLQVGMAHISTDLFEKFNIRAVKVNASSKCNIPQTNVTITVEIWKKGKLQNHLVLTKTINSSGTTYPGSQVNNFSTYKFCENIARTSYYGVAYSKAFIAGKWQYARHVLSLETIPLNCGT
ncbi:MAG: hypothetical protein ACOYK4_02950 [Candidatus Planktophila sp.]